MGGGGYTFSDYYAGALRAKTWIFSSYPLLFHWTLLYPLPRENLVANNGIFTVIGDLNFRFQTNKCGKETNIALFTILAPPPPVWKRTKGIYVYVMRLC